MDLWVDSILEGYITKITMDVIKSYSEVKREFFWDPIGRYLKSLKPWIKMLAWEKWILWMEYAKGIIMHVGHG